MDIASRIKYLRKEVLKISQEAFGEKIGVSDTTISKVEKGISTLTERNIKSICKEFNVSIMWLKEGLGDIFTTSTDTTLDKLAEEYNLNEPIKNLIKNLLELDEKSQELLVSILEKTFK